MGLILSVGSSFLLDPTLNTNQASPPKIVFPYMHPCHTWNLGLGTPCEVVSPNCHSLNGFDCMD